MRIAFAAVAAAALTTIGCSRGSDDAMVMQAGAPSAAEVAAVQRSIDSSLALFMDAMKRSDSRGAASIFAEDAIVMQAGVKAIRGHAEIIAANDATFSAITVPEMAIRTSDLIVSGDYAIETGTYDMMVQPKGGKAMRDVGKYVSVWRRGPDGGWKIIRDVVNTDIPTQR